ncbi:MAG: hypothetical protein V3U86_00875 [Acidobacteriota bacterium]
MKAGAAAGSQQIKVGIGPAKRAAGNHKLSDNEGAKVAELADALDLGSRFY